jgi:hypothetical protein
MGVGMEAGGSSVDWTNPVIGQFVKVELLMRARGRLLRGFGSLRAQPRGCPSLGQTNRFTIC